VNFNRMMFTFFLCFKRIIKLHPMFLFGLGWRVKMSSLGAGVINESWWVSEKSESEVSEVR